MERQLTHYVEQTVGKYVSVIVYVFRITPDSDGGRGVNARVDRVN